MASFCPNFLSSIKLMAAVIALILLNGCAGGSSPSNDRAATAGSAPQTDDNRRFSVQLAWNIPLARTNGDVLYANELVGYEIIYSNEFDNSPHQLRIEDPLQTETDVTDLPAGQYRFAIAAIDENGIYSSFSESVEITLD